MVYQTHRTSHFSAAGLQLSRIVLALRRHHLVVGVERVALRVHAGKRALRLQSLLGQGFELLVHAVVGRRQLLASRLAAAGPLCAHLGLDYATCNEVIS